jgi:hypothetical protein
VLCHLLCRQRSCYDSVLGTASSSLCARNPKPWCSHHFLAGTAHTLHTILHKVQPCPRWRHANTPMLSWTATGSPTAAVLCRKYPNDFFCIYCISRLLLGILVQCRLALSLLPPSRRAHKCIRFPGIPQTWHSKRNLRVRLRQQPASRDAFGGEPKVNQYPVFCIRIFCLLPPGVLLLFT